MKSVLQSQKECFLCGSQIWLEEHHIFGGAFRKKSEKYGLKVYLCHYCHNEPPNGVHHCQTINLVLKKEGQKAFERIYDHDLFISEFEKNYL